MKIKSLFLIALFVNLLNISCQRPVLIFDSVPYPPLHQAVENDDITEVKRLLTKEAWKENSINTHYWTSEININLKSLDNKTVLFYVQSLEMTNFLIEQGADINARDNDGDTALHKVANADVAKLLIEKGVNVNALNNRRNTPLQYAKNVALAKLLIQKGADVNAQNKYGKTFLHKVESRTLAKLLIQKGAHVNVQDNIKNTPLHYADNAAIAKLLIENGAHINALNNSGDTPYSRLLGLNRRKPANYLRSRGGLTKEEFQAASPDSASPH